jgi:hypothetical protein
MEEFLYFINDIGYLTAPFAAVFLCDIESEAIFRLMPVFHESLEKTMPFVGE